MRNDVFSEILDSFEIFKPFALADIIMFEYDNSISNFNITCWGIYLITTSLNLFANLVIWNEKHFLKRTELKELHHQVFAFW
jgi:hypothetical protein